MNEVLTNRPCQPQPAPLVINYGGRRRRDKTPHAAADSCTYNTCIMDGDYLTTQHRASNTDYQDVRGDVSRYPSYILLLTATRRLSGYRVPSHMISDYFTRRSTFCQGALLIAQIDNQASARRCTVRKSRSKTTFSLTNILFCNEHCRSY